MEGMKHSERVHRATSVEASQAPSPSLDSSRRLNKKIILQQHRFKRGGLLKFQLIEAVVAWIGGLIPSPSVCP